MAKLCPFVEELGRNVSPGGIGTAVNLVPIMVLEKVTTLRLFDFGLYGRVIESLSFPSLQRMDLSGMEVDEHMFRTELRSFLGRFGSSVTHLCLSFNAYLRRNILSETSVEDVLQPMHRLIRLTVACSIRHTSTNRDALNCSLTCSPAS